MNRTHYFLQLAVEGAPEMEVSEAEFVKAERAAGFHNTLGRPDEPATGGFSTGTIRGRVKYISDDEGKDTTP